jgi:plastocyanin
MQAARIAAHPAWAGLVVLFSFCTICSCTDDGGGSSGAKGGTGGSSNAAGGTAPVSNGGANAAGASPEGAAGDSGAAGASAAAGSEAGAAGSAAEVIPDFNGCTAAAYEDDRAASAARIIGIATEGGLNFTPKCMTIAVGQTVRWEGSLAAHPLAPGNIDHPEAGSPDSPIVVTSSGSSVEFTFNSAGTFPYVCQVHSFGDGLGMAGVVHVAR